jgi:SNF2 family DNA or RNA helicase
MEYGTSFPPTQGTIDFIRKKYPEIEICVKPDPLFNPSNDYKNIEFNHPLLDPYQIDGVKKLIYQRRVLLADEVGLGKTVQSLLAIDHIFKDQHETKVLVITRKNLCSQWGDEIEKWLGKDSTWKKENFALIRGKKRFNRWQEFRDNDKSFFLINHEANFNDLPHIKFDAVIVDEAHLVKGRNGKRREQILRFTKPKNIPVYLLTGTPQEKSPSDMWGLLNMLYPDHFTSFWAFYNAFTATELDYTGYTKIIGGKNIQQLHNMIYNFYLRRLRKNEKSGIQDPQVIKYTSTPIRVQTILQRRIRNEAYLSDYDIEISNPMVRMMLERKLSCGMLPDGNFLNCDYLPKAKILQTIIEDNVDKKIIVFAAFRDIVKHYAKIFESNYYIGGSAEKYLTEFKTDPSKKLLFATPESLGTGLNITEASIIVFLQAPLSGTQNIQAIGRITRIGQNEQPLVYYLCDDGSIDEYIFSLIQRKKYEFNKTTLIQDYEKWAV